MALIVKYKFQNVDANGNSVSLLPQFPSGVSYTKTDVVEGNITTRTVETDDLSKVTYIRFGCNEDTYVTGAWEYLTEILDINISYVSTFYRMFRGCKKLNNIDVSNWDTSNVTSMVSMFYYCSKLTQLDVSNFNTSNVTNMNYMFYGCSKLTQLDVSNWNTKNVTSMSNMFHACSNLTQLDVSNFNTSNVTSMASMFYGCSKLTQLDVSNWDTSKVTNMSYMFNACSNLTQLDVSNFDTSNVTSMASMFNACKQLTQLDVSNFDTSNVDNMGKMFYGCSKLTQLDVSNFDTSNVTDMVSMFYNCSKLAQLDVSNFNTSNITSINGMFHSCINLTQLDVSNFNTSNVTSMNATFNNCQSLTSLDISNFDTSNVKDTGYMFYNCISLTLLDLSNFDTSKVTNMVDMINSCGVENVGLIYCSKETIDNLANCITSPCNFYVTNKAYTSPNPLVKYVMYREDKKPLLYYNDETQAWEKPVLREWDTIEKHSDGKYYYHKRSEEVVLDGSEKWVLDSTQENTCRYRVRNKNIKNNAKLIADRFIFRGNLAHGDYEYIFMNDALNLYININKSKLSTQDVSGFKAWLQANPTTVVYQLADEKVYECTDLDLVTYTDTTSLMVERGVIAPKTTLKTHRNIANITTILQEKVSVLENNVLDRVKKLEGSTASTVTTESDFTTVEQTANGYFEDMKLEGRTLVNLYPKLDAKNYSPLGATLSNDTITINANGTWRNFMLNKDVMPLKTSTYYTFVIYIIDNTITGNDPIIHFGDTLPKDPTKFIDSYHFSLRNKKGIYAFKLKTKDSFDNALFDTRDHLTDKATSGTIVFKYMILEGDHTQNPPEYFEGIKSVGQDVDEISVLSTSKNLFDEELVMGNIDELSGIEIESSQRARSNFINIKNITNLVVSCLYEDQSIEKFLFYDKDKKYIGFSKNVTTNVPQNAEFVRLTLCADRTETMTQLEVGTVSTQYVKHKQDKKRILYYNDETQTWEKPILRQWDSIEKHSDGKYYYHKRSGEAIVDGKNWYGYIERENTVRVTRNNIKHIGYNNFITDKYIIQDIYNNDIEGIQGSVTSTDLFISINKSKLLEISLNGVSNYLNSNNFVIVYQLAEEKVYECTDLDLITYENETNFILNTGAITPKSTLKVMCNITNVVRELQQKVSNLENYIQHVMIDALNNALNE